MQRQKAVFSSILLALMVLINTASLHVFAHDHHTEDDCANSCVICDFAVEMQTEGFFLAEQTPIEISVETTSHSSQLNFNELELTKVFNGSLFCRPPPILS